MSLPYRQQRRLRRLDHALRLSDPHLAAMLTIFARISAGENLPAREQVRSSGRVRSLLAWLAAAAAWLALHAARVVARAVHATALAASQVRGAIRGAFTRKRAARPGDDLPPFGKHLADPPGHV
jgi:3-methyladenine DNA glycosylase AlkC